MQKLRMEMRKLTVGVCQLLRVRWDKLKKDQTESFCLVFLDVFCEFVYANTIIFFNLGE